MSDDDLIRRGDALAAVQEWTYCCDAEEAIAALPARGVGVDIEDMARTIYDAMRFDRKDKTPEWVKGGNSNAQVEARSTAARILAALAPTDTAQAREAALWEAWNVVWEAKTLLDAKNALHALIGEART